MFKFNFDVDAEPGDDGFEAGAAHASTSTTTVESQNDEIVEDPTARIDVHELLSALPAAISFSPFAIPLSSKEELILARRDLFDVRFQLITADEDASSGVLGGPSAIEYVDAPSDLVPGVYEGGLKTWECSLDLVGCLDSIYRSEVVRSVRGKRILELGCGTAVPSVYLLHSIFSAPPTVDEASRSSTDVHLQDYNALVLKLVTLPNVILAWYMSPASSAFRTESTSGGGLHDKPEEDLETDEPLPFPPADPSQPGELPITPALIAAFLASLKTYNISLEFFSASWSTFDVRAAGGPYDIVLTSETIYRTASLPSLVDLLRRASGSRACDRTRSSPVSVEEAVEELSLAGTRRLARSPHLCLVAAKLVYFGVGGGVNEFVTAVESPLDQRDSPAAFEKDASTRGGSRGVVRTVWERSSGVRRQVMQVTWETV